MFDWAIEQELATINPAELINPKKAFGRRKVRHHASLELTEVPNTSPEFWSERTDGGATA